MKKLWLLLPLLLLTACDTGSDNNRFVLEGEYTVKGGSMSVKTFRDTYTGCEYLLAYNGVTAMPHTCNIDQPH